MNSVRTVDVGRVGDYRRTNGGVYVPNKKLVGKILEGKKITDSRGYIPQGNELNIIEVARKLRHPLLFVGPSGIGKTRLVEHLAHEFDYPLITLVMNRDMTDGKMRGGSRIRSVPVEIDDRVESLTLSYLEIKPLSLAGLSGYADIPVILYIDEVHKIRESIDSVLHTILENRKINLEEIIGESYSLHPNSMIILSGNDYQDVGGGMENLSTPLRQRLATVNFGYVTEESILRDIINANISDIPFNLNEEIGRLCRVTALFAKSFENLFEIQQNNEQTIGSILANNGIVEDIIEPPSPRMVVRAVEALIAGLNIEDVLNTYISGPIARGNNRVVATALREIYKTY